MYSVLTKYEKILPITISHKSHVWVNNTPCNGIFDLQWHFIVCKSVSCRLVFVVYNYLHRGFISNRIISILTEFVFICN
jgi:hypothetical protein